MTAVLVSTLAVATLIAAILLMLPVLSRASLPLGVLVPRSRASDPVVVTAVRRFRIGVVASYVVALVAAALVAPLGPAAPPLAATVVLLVGSVAAFLLCRRSIRAAKREGGWLDDVPVRITGSVTPDSAASPRPAYGWFAAALVVLAAAAAVGASLYAGLPATIAVHWDASGRPDRFAETSFWSVFGPIVIGVGVLALIVGIAFVVRSVPWRRGGGRPETAAQIAALQAHLTQSLLGWIAFMVSAAISVLSVLGWWHAESSEPSAGVAVVAVGLVVVIVVVIAAYAVRLVSGTRAIRARVGVASGATGAADAAERDTVDPRDDDRHWKGGLIYVNAGDPALFVPKRFGVGVTLNVGHPGGIAIAVVTLLLIVAALSLPVLLR